MKVPKLISFLLKKKPEEKEILEIKGENKSILFQGKYRSGINWSLVPIFLSYQGSMIIENDFKGEMWTYTAAYRGNELKQDCILIYKEKEVVYLKKYGKERVELKDNIIEYLKKYIKEAQNHVSIYLNDIKVDNSILDCLQAKTKEIFFIKKCYEIKPEGEEIKEILKSEINFLLVNYSHNLKEIEKEFDLKLIANDDLSVTLEKKYREKMKLKYFFRDKKMMEKIYLYPFENIGGEYIIKNIILTKLEYETLSYEKVFDFENGKLLVNNKGKYQHRISFVIDNKLWELRGGNFKNTNIFWEDRSITGMIYLFEYLGKSFEYVDLEMDRDITNIQEHQKDNFPRRIKFLNKDKEVVLKLIFNDYGFLIRVIDEFQDFIYEDKEVLSFDSTESFILSKIKE
ncbi:hypothetical protein [Fusobacterium ulcerans]|uniref:hypothetical protein n=1 Tax=Fusobacterium ulcerans TaxID=861 RepID=UPI001D0BDC14|nr:hypothetical protein [Fusobacterium ulcerans]MCB8566312.1 hypothetical protein [Fusobacterium ulcerans]MCB8650385.1 hypothetical protein [Fusobacterium ulcerans]